MCLPLLCTNNTAISVFILIYPSKWLSSCLLNKVLYTTWCQERSIYWSKSTVGTIYWCISMEMMILWLYLLGSHRSIYLTSICLTAVLSHPRSSVLPCSVAVLLGYDEFFPCWSECQIWDVSEWSFLQSPIVRPPSATLSAQPEPLFLWFERYALCN